MEFFKILFSESITAAFLGLIPMVIVGWVLNRRRVNFRAASLDPFTDQPLRPPGESLRMKIQELSDDFDANFFGAAMISVSATTLMIALPPSSTGGPSTRLILFLVIAAAWGWVFKKLYALQKELWDYRLGFTGERVVGEELNQLIADGFQVFHDVPFEEKAAKFNLDHVVVGPPGVYLVETKTRRKPAALRGTERATVTVDGEMLHFPTWHDSYGIKQAADNAITLSRWLTSSTGEPTLVHPILTLPGWWVERKAVGRVNVLNPKELRKSLRARTTTRLSPERIQRIVHQLTDRCRLKKPE